MINPHYLFLIRYAQFEGGYSAICDNLESLRMMEGTPDERNALLSETCAMCVDFIDDSEELLELGSKSAPFLRDKGHVDDEVMESLLDVCVRIRKKVTHVSRFNTVVVKAMNDSGESDTGEAKNPFADLVGIEEPEEEPFVPKETVVPLEFEEDSPAEVIGEDESDEEIETESVEEAPAKEESANPEEPTEEPVIEEETPAEETPVEEPAPVEEPKPRRRFGFRRGSE